MLKRRWAVYRVRWRGEGRHDGVVRREGILYATRQFAHEELLRLAQEEELGDGEEWLLGEQEDKPAWDAAVYGRRQTVTGDRGRRPGNASNIGAPGGAV